MKSSVFEYTDYKKYLRARIGRGEKSRIAETLRCHVAYISRIFNGDAHFSLEQALALTTYLGLSKEEVDFFLLLVLRARAGTSDLEKHYAKEISTKIETRGILKNRLETNKTLSEKDQNTYFSAWFYSAIHLLVAIPQFQSRENLARYLRLSQRKVTQALSFLTSSGLVVEKNGRYQTGPTYIHLGNDSPLISKHHTNWRIQAIQSLEDENSDELHYSSAVTIARKDIPEIRKALVTAIENVRAVVKASSEECLCCYALDFFEVGRR